MTDIPWDAPDLAFSSLVGKTLMNIEGLEPGGEVVRFTTADGEVFALHHSQDCCESVSINDVVGDVLDLIGSPIVIAEEAVSDSRPADIAAPDYEPESQTWTFYKLATIRGYVDVRWLGESNGYYSERVSFVKLEAA